MKDLLSKIISSSILIFITVATVLYSEGWRINTSQDNGDTNQPQIIKTGMLAVRSIPEAGKVYIDNEAVTATDDTISALNPGTYKLKIIKEGYEPWEKNVEVYPELVTDITAILILQSPRLEPLTSSDVTAFSMSNNQNRISFTTKNPTNPGIWILPLSQTGMNLFRNDAYPLIKDSPQTAPSLAEELSWSPDDTELLVKMNEKGYLLYTLSGTSTAEKVEILNDTKPTHEKWNEYWNLNFKQDITPILEKQKAQEDVMSKLDNSYGSWSPDNKKFYYMTETLQKGIFNLNIYNAEDPLPVGEKRQYITLSGVDPVNTKAYWYSDSYHLILVEKASDRPNFYTVSLIRIDGTNKTVIYTGNLASHEAYSTPGGDKIIVLTSLKENTPNNLYSISIR